MFNKPALFPKAPEAQPPRGPRMGGNAPSGPATGLNPGSLSPAPASALKEVAASAPKSSEETSAAESAPLGDNRLIVGPNVKLKGAQILDCDTLVVEGRVEATMDSRVLRIAENGSFSGTVGIDVAEIHGRFDGELTARSQLVIHSSGRVSGKIRYGKILIEEGGEISGDVKALSAESGRGLEKKTLSSEQPQPPIAAAG